MVLSALLAYNRLRNWNRLRRAEFKQTENIKGLEQKVQNAHRYRDAGKFSSQLKSRIAVVTLRVGAVISLSWQNSYLRHKHVAAFKQTTAILLSFGQESHFRFSAFAPSYSPDIRSQATSTHITQEATLPLASSFSQSFWHLRRRRIHESLAIIVHISFPQRLLVHS
jgi:hypothetical protein